MTDTASISKSSKKDEETKTVATGDSGKSKAAKTPKGKASKTKPPKEPATKREKAPREDLVVFAFRLTKDQRDTIHAAAGPAKASQFVLAAALAAAAKK